MIGLTTNEALIKEEMIHKLLNDPDKFERMFAAQYLFKYNYSETKSILKNALNDRDPEVVVCITRLFECKEE